MNRRLGGDSSLNSTAVQDTDGGGEWQDWLVDEEDTPGRCL
jgi:RNA polymerase sigma-32 factor